jgi:hypothetical protein
MSTLSKKEDGNLLLKMHGTARNSEIQVDGLVL